MRKLKNYLGILVIILPSFIAAPLAAESLWTRSVDIRDGVPAPSAIQLAMAFKATAATHGIDNGSASYRRFSKQNKLDGEWARRYHHVSKF